MILGIDPGTTRVGWAIVEKTSHTPVAKKFGCILSESIAGDTERLVAVYDAVVQIIELYKPDCIAIEELFFSTNAKTVITVGQGRGVVLLAAGQRDIPVTSYNPMTIKLAITGYGKADKSQVTKMVMATLKLKIKPTPDDTADALAVALTHAFTARKVEGKR